MICQLKSIEQLLYKTKEKHLFHLVLFIIERPRNVFEAMHSFWVWNHTRS